MSRPLVRLTSAAVEKRGVGTLTDPAVAGLMLRVRKTSTRGIVREFRFRYKFRRRTGVITLGNFPGLSLADARAGAQRFRDLLQEGIDPRSAMKRPGTRAAVEVPAAGNSHNVAALIKDFTERHLRKRRKHPEYAERILQKELAALLANVDEVTKRAKRTGIAIRVILLTAVRRSELTGARWSELDLETKAPVWEIPAQRTKTGVSFAVPLTPPTVEQFRRLKRLAGRSPWIFPAETGDGSVDPRLLTRSIARHLETFAEHKVGAFTLHDLRRTVRTGLAKLGIRPDIAERCLNHAQPGIIATYDTHQYLDEKRDALTQWADHLRAPRDDK
jgi:integrase